MSVLFEATSINGMRLENRLVRSATWVGMATARGEATDDLTRILCELADGRVGLIVCGHAYVRPEGQAGVRQLGIHADELVDGLRADAVVVLADSEQVQANAASPYLADTIDRQLAQADIVLLTKADLVSDAQRERVIGWLRGKARGARVIPAIKGDVPLSAVVGALPLPARGKGTAAETHGAFASIVLEPAGPVDADALAAALGADTGVTRAKGFVQTADGMALIHVVGHRATAEPATGDHPVGVVCIGVREVFDAERLRGLV